jgi:hypothetical protein
MRISVVCSWSGASIDAYRRLALCRHTLTITTIEYQLMNPPGPVARVSID